MYYEIQSKNLGRKTSTLRGLLLINRHQNSIIVVHVFQSFPLLLYSGYLPHKSQQRLFIVDFVKYNHICCPNVISIFWNIDRCISWSFIHELKFMWTLLPHQTFSVNYIITEIFFQFCANHVTILKLWCKLCCHTKFPFCQVCVNFVTTSNFPFVQVYVNYVTIALL